jgi:hypothetical protein
MHKENASVLLVQNVELFSAKPGGTLEVITMSMFFNLRPAAHTGPWHQLRGLSQK